MTRHGVWIAAFKEVLDGCYRFGMAKARAKVLIGGNFAGDAALERRQCLRKSL